MTCAHCNKPIHPRFRNTSQRNANKGRNLCQHCHKHLTTTGQLADYERPTRPRDDLLDDYVILRAEGHTWRQCAQRLGMTYPAFERAMLRARAAGDERALRIGELAYQRTKQQLRRAG